MKLNIHIHMKLGTLESLLIGAVIFFHIDPFEQSLIKYVMNGEKMFFIQSHFKVTAKSQ